MRLGIAHHFGWAVAVTAAGDHSVVDRRRIELVEPGVAAAPIHTDGKQLDDAAAAELVAAVRASAVRASGAALDAIASSVREPIVSMSLRAWPRDFPEDIAVQRRVPYEARADSVMYRQVLADLARERGWQVHLFEAKDVEAQAARSSAVELQASSTDRGRRWGHPGARIIASPWRQPSSPVSPRRLETERSGG